MQEEITLEITYDERPIEMTISLDQTVYYALSQYALTAQNENILQGHELYGEKGTIAPYLTLRIALSHGYISQGCRLHIVESQTKPSTSSNI